MEAKKRLYTIKFVPNESAKTITLKLEGHDGGILDEYRAELEALSEPNRLRCELLGFSNTIRDAGAVSQGADPRHRFARMKKRAQFLETGGVDWSERQPTEGGLLFQALMRKNGKLDAETLKEKLSTLTKGQKDALLLSERLKPYVDAIRKEQGTAVQVDALFAELEQL